MSRLIVFAGLPASGKSTIAREVAAQIGVMWLRIDSMDQAIWASGTAPSDLRDWTYRAAQAIAIDNLVLGRAVIADCVNDWRGGARRMAARRRHRRRTDRVAGDRLLGHRRASTQGRGAGQRDSRASAAELGSGEPSRISPVGSRATAHRHRAQEHRRLRCERHSRPRCVTGPRPSAPYSPRFGPNS